MATGPLEQQSTIVVNQHGFLGYVLPDYAVNANQILQSKPIPNEYNRTLSMISPAAAPYHIDWKANDAFVQKMNDITNVAYDNLHKSHEFNELLKKPHWTKQDCEKYEQMSAKAITNEMNKVPQFQIRPDDKLAYDSRINNLMDANSSNQILDCRANSIITASAIQMLENKMNLPAAAPEGDYKKAANYFRISNGGVSGGNFDSGDTVERHAFVVSSRTGNVLDRMSGGDPYIRSIQGNTFKDFIDGKPIVGATGVVYGDVTNLDGMKKAREAALGMKKKPAPPYAPLQKQSLPLNAAPVAALARTPAAAAPVDAQRVSDTALARAAPFTPDVSDLGRGGGSTPPSAAAATQERAAYARMTGGYRATSSLASEQGFGDPNAGQLRHEFQNVRGSLYDPSAPVVQPTNDPVLSAGAKPITFLDLNFKAYTM